MWKWNFERSYFIWLSQVISFLLSNYDWNKITFQQMLHEFYLKINKYFIIDQTKVIPFLCTYFGVLIFHLSPFTYEKLDRNGIWNCDASLQFESELDWNVKENLYQTLFQTAQRKHEDYCELELEFITETYLNNPFAGIKF